ncbi:dihydrolipoamide acetyltransferase family protein [Candidatus Latescibacterota bacterium]
MPKLGLTMERGTVAAWLVEEGGEVLVGAPLLEVVTDKVTMEVEAQVSGILRRILVPAGVEVEVATPIALIGEPDEDIPEAAAVAPAAVAPPAPADPVVAPASAPAAPGRHQRHRASPKARRMAAEHGLDLAGLAGSGAGGRIVSADVAAALESGARGVTELTPAQSLGAQRLAASYREAPHIHVAMDVDALWMRQLRQGFESRGDRVSYNDIILRAAALTLVDIPRANCLFESGRVQEQTSVDIGIATDTPQGLVVPVLRGAAERTIDDIAAESTRLVEGARTGRLGPDEYAGGTFTISNLGMFGVRSFTAILNPPQVAILAVGAVAERVVSLASAGQGAASIGVRPAFTATLGIDHRVLDGATAARFLQRLKEYLESPGRLG